MERFFGVVLLLYLAVGILLAVPMAVLVYISRGQGTYAGELNPFTAAVLVVAWAPLMLSGKVRLRIRRTKTGWSIDGGVSDDEEGPP